MTVNEDYINAMVSTSDQIITGPGEEYDEFSNLEKRSFLGDTFICHIRMDMINPGEIVAVSRSCFGFTGYTEHELLKTKINRLMPKVIADCHDSILRQYISVGMTFTNERINSFMKMKDCALKPIHLMIKLFYQVHGNIEMVGLFRETKSRIENPEYIVMNSAGVVFG